VHGKDLTEKHVKVSKVNKGIKRASSLRSQSTERSQNT